MRLRSAAVWAPLLVAAALFVVCAILASSGSGGRDTATIILVAATIASVTVGEWMTIPTEVRQALRILAFEALAAAVLVAGLQVALTGTAAGIGAGLLSLIFLAALLAPAPSVLSAPTSPTRSNDDLDWRRRTRRSRWVAAGVVLVAITVLVLVSHLGSSLRSCEETVATVGNRPVIEVCRALDLNDLLPLLLLAVLFLLPDLSAIKIAGLGEIEMRQERQEATLITLRRGLGPVLVESAYEVSLEKMEERLGEPGDAGGDEEEASVLREEGAGMTSPGEPSAREPVADRAEAIAELDLLWRRLDGAVRLGERCADPTFLSRASVYVSEPVNSRAILLTTTEASLVTKTGVKDAEELRALARWASLFEEEIVAVRLIAETSVESAVPASTESIRQAVTVARRLGSLLPDGVRGAAGFD